jgi:hypothetical protein
MHRFRSWTLDPPEWRTQRNRILAVEGGDGSTLSLDFTTGILDPRLAFTRTTNATFINSQGYVQYALANMQANTNFDGIDGTTYQVPWGGFVGTGASFERLSSGVLKCKAATSGAVANSNRAFLSTNATIPIGLPITLKVTIQDKVVSATLDIVNFLSFVTAATSYTQYRVNGVAQPTSFNSIAIGDVITLTVIPTQANGNFRVGLGCNVNQSLNNYVTIANVMLEQGEETKANYVFLPNSSTSLGNFNTPRFDYDPTTTPPTPRGLLIEGSATNLCEQGQYCWGTGATKTWVRSAGININSVNGTTGSNTIARIDGPDGGSLTGTSVVKDASLQFVRFNVDVTVSPSTTYTFSAYVRAPSGGNPYMRLAAFNGGTWLSTTGATTASGITITDTANNGSRFNGVPSTAWVRVWVTFTTQAGQTAATIAFYPDTDTTNAATMYVWGAQVEAGSGASSYIPTGASTGNRAEDTCYMDGTNFSSWYSASTQTGTLFADITHSALVNTNGGIELGNGLGSQASSNRVSLRRDGVIVDGVSSITVSPTGASQRFKTAIAFAPGTSNTAACRNGGTVSNPAQAAGTLSGINALKFYIDASPALRPYGWIRQVKVWPTRLSNAQLQALTTG